jgi:hypothetical protein
VPRILGYGEDALTLWALGSRLADVLTHPKLRDTSPAANALVMYRPSFGRGRRRGSADKAVPRAEFGEFDAIVGTALQVYLVESKWEGSSEIEPSGTIHLRSEQTRRHRIFEWTLRQWRAAHVSDWDTFASDDRERAFQKEFSDHKLAPKGSRLARNLEFVLKQLAEFRGEIKHVLLFFHLLEAPTASGVDRPEFVFVPFRAVTVPESMYLDIAIPERAMARAEGEPAEPSAVPDPAA